MGDEFARTVTKLAVAAACATQGFTHSHNCVIDTLVDVVRNFILSAGEGISRRAQISARSQCGLQDAIAEFRTPRLLEGGFNSLIKFASKSMNKGDEEGPEWQLPFPGVIAPFPVEYEPPASSTATDGQTTIRPYIPKHLPMFPPAYTIKKPLSRKRKRNDGADRAKRLKSIRQLQQSLARIDGDSAPLREADRPVHAKNESSQASSKEKNVLEGNRTLDENEPADKA